MTQELKISSFLPLFGRIFLILLISFTMSQRGATEPSTFIICWEKNPPAEVVKAFLQLLPSVELAPLKVSSPLVQRLLREGRLREDQLKPQTTEEARALGLILEAPVILLELKGQLTAVMTARKEVFPLRTGEDVHQVIQSLQLSPSPAEERWQKALSWIEKGKGQEALAYLEALGTALSYKPEYYFSLGKAFYLCGLLKEARKAYQQGLSLDPNNIQGLLNFARLEAEGSRLPEAIRLTRLAIQKMENPQEAWVFLGDLYSIQGNWSQAEEAYRSGGKIPEAMTGLAKVLARKGAWSEAIQFAQRSLIAQPNQPDLCVLIAQGLSHLNRPLEAVQWYLQGLKQRAQQVHTLKPHQMKSFWADLDRLLLELLLNSLKLLSKEVKGDREREELYPFIEESLLIADPLILETRNMSQLGEEEFGLRTMALSLWSQAFFSWIQALERKEGFSRVSEPLKMAIETLEQIKKGRQRVDELSRAGQYGRRNR